MSEYPKLVVFDLDYTLWPCWCDTHVLPPFAYVNPSDKGLLKDRYGEEIGFYKDVPEILTHIRDSPHYAAVSASRTHAPDVAKEMLKKLEIQGEPSSNFLDHKVWGYGTKIDHFKQLHQLTGVDFKDMVFYDDESRNKDVEKALGVTFVLVRNGVNWNVFNKGIDLWRKRTKSNV